MEQKIKSHYGNTLTNGMHAHAHTNSKFRRGGGGDPAEGEVGRKRERARLGFYTLK